MDVHSYHPWAVITFHFQMEKKTDSWASVILLWWEAHPRVSMKAQCRVFWSILPGKVTMVVAFDFCLSEYWGVAEIKVLDALEIHLRNSMLECSSAGASAVVQRLPPHLWKQHQGVVVVFPHPLQCPSPGIWHSFPSPGEKQRRELAPKLLRLEGGGKMQWNVNGGLRERDWGAVLNSSHFQRGGESRNCGTTLY